MLQITIVDRKAPSVSQGLRKFFHCFFFNHKQTLLKVGNGELDHGSWGRPEEMRMSRPSYKITTSKPGSDLAAETAAALAAISVVFRQVDRRYADLLVRHARELYDFADKYRYLQNI